jgi:hypothetical protein
VDNYLKKVTKPTLLTLRLVQRQVFHSILQGEIMLRHDILAALFLCLVIAAPAAAHKGFNEPSASTKMSDSLVCAALSDERVVSTMRDFAGRKLLSVQYAEYSEYGDGDGGGYMGYTDAALRFVYGPRTKGGKGGYFDVLFANDRGNKIERVTRPHAGR